MRTQHARFMLARLTGGVARLAGSILDVLGWGALVVALEAAGPYATTDMADLMALAGAGAFVILLILGARAGLLPATAYMLRGLRAGLGRLGRHLTPAHAVGFRRNDEARQIRSDPLLQSGLLALLAVAAVCTLGGPWVLAGLLALKIHVSYTLYLACLAVLWSLMAALVFGGMLIGTQWALDDQASHGRLKVSLSWILGVVALLTVPGWTVLLAFTLLGWRLYTQVARPSTTPVLLCRRDARGGPLMIGVERWIRRAFAAALLLVLATLGLGQATRIDHAGLPIGPWASTGALATLASLAAFLIVGRTASHLVRLGGGANGPGEPFAPRLGVLPGVPAGPWHDAALDEGLALVPLQEPRRPADTIDLVLGDPGDPRRLEPRADASVEDLRWQIRRRLHVVMRRRVRKPLRRLVKAVVAARGMRGTGCLFCPHVWIVPGLMRDLDPTRGRNRLAAPMQVGPAYRVLFDNTTRQYLGSMFRAVEIDLIYFGDGLAWKHWNSVLGVLYECWDQGRTPVRPRHFAGLPGVRVDIEDEPAESEPPKPGWLPAGARTRVLIVQRDHGGSKAKEETPAPSTREPMPLGV